MVVVSSETEKETAAAEKVTETAAREEDLSNYEQVYIKMATAADETKNQCTLTGVTMWKLDLLIRRSRESSRSCGGVIISKTDKDLLILTEKDTIDDTDSIKVTFEDGTLADGWIQDSDEISDLAVVKVFSKDLSEETTAYVEAANFCGFRRNEDRGSHHSPECRLCFFWHGNVTALSFSL